MQDYLKLGNTQNDIHTGRLFCWSGALVTISIWATTQFLEGQNRNWHRQHPHSKPTQVTEETSIPPHPKTIAMWRRVYERENRRAALVKRVQMP